MSFTYILKALSSSSLGSCSTGRSLWPMASPDAALRKFACGRKGGSARTGNGGASSRANFALQANHFARRNLLNLPVSASDASREEDHTSPDTVLKRNICMWRFGWRGSFHPHLACGYVKRWGGGVCGWKGAVGGWGGAGDGMQLNCVDRLSKTTDNSSTKEKCSTSLL